MSKKRRFKDMLDGVVDKVLDAAENLAGKDWVQGLGDDKMHRRQKSSFPLPTDLWIRPHATDPMDEDLPDRTARRHDTRPDPEDDDWRT